MADKKQRKSTASALPQISVEGRLTSPLDALSPIKQHQRRQLKSADLKRLTDMHALQVDGDLFSPQLSDLDRKGVYGLQVEKKLSPMVDLTPVFLPKIYPNLAPGRSKSLTVDALVDSVPVPLHRRPGRRRSNDTIGKFLEYRHEIGTPYHRPRYPNEDHSANTTLYKLAKTLASKKTSSLDRLPPVSDLDPAKDEDDEESSFQIDSTPHYPSLVDLEQGSAATNGAIHKADNRVLMSKRFLKKSTTNYSLQKQRDSNAGLSAVAGGSSTSNLVAKTNVHRKYRKLPIDTVILSPEELEQRRQNRLTISEEEQEMEEEQELTLRKVRQKIRDKIIYELNKGFSKRNIKLNNEDIKTFWQKINTEQLSDEIHLFNPSARITITVSNGRISETSAEFIEFMKRSEQRGYKNTASQILRKIEKLCQRYSVPWAEVDSASVEKHIHKGRLTTQQTITNEMLLDCLVNQEQVLSFMEFPGQIYKGAHGMDLAATKIQSTWRMYQAQSILKKIEPRLHALGVILKRWTVRKKRLMIKSFIKELEEFHIKRADALREILKSKYETIKQQPRVIVHVPSYRHDVANEEFQHFIRISDAKDKNVFVILVLREQPDEEQIEHIRNTLLECMDSERTDKCFAIVVPKCAGLFQRNSSLLEMLLTSHQTLCEIRELIGNRPACIVGGENDPKTFILSSVLEIPLLTPSQNVLDKLTSPEFLRELQDIMANEEIPPPAIPWEAAKMDVTLYFHYYIDASGAISDLGPSEYLDFGAQSCNLLPAQHYPISSLSGIVIEFATKCFDLGHVGYVSFKFVKDANSSNVFVTEVFPFYTEKNMKLHHFLTATNTRYDGDGHYLFDVRQALVPEFSFLKLIQDIVEDAEKKALEKHSNEQRVGLWCDGCFHSNMTAMPSHVFYILCRSADIEFDSQMRIGTLMIRSKVTFVANQTGFLIIQSSFAKCLASAMSTLGGIKRLLHVYGMECASNIDLLVKKYESINPEAKQLIGAKGPTAKVRQPAGSVALPPGAAKLEDTEDQMYRTSTVNFVNPSAQLFENQFMKTLSDKYEAKMAFVKQFIATDIMYDIMSQVNEHIKTVETKRFNDWVEMKLKSLLNPGTTAEGPPGSTRPGENDGAQKLMVAARGFQATRKFLAGTQQANRKLPPPPTSLSSKRL